MQAIYSTTARQGRGPLLTELEAIYAVLDDKALIERLRAYRWTGRPGFSIEALWRSYLAGFVLNLGSTNALVRRLQDDAPLAELCGFSELPSRWTFNRFVIRLSQHLDLVEQVFRSATREVAEQLNGAFGYMMAVDATVVHTHSNPNKKTISDPEASWTAKGWKVKGGKDWYFGYKMHLVADADTELPIAAIVTTAKVNDTTQLLPLLAKVKAELGIKPSYVLADAGYDSSTNIDGIAHGYAARPIIKIRGPKRHHLKGYRPLRIKIDQKSQQWKNAYSRRQSVERVFSRLKGHGSLGQHCRRGLAKVTLHCFSAILITQARALSQIRGGSLTQIRNCTRKVA